MTVYKTLKESTVYFVSFYNEDTTPLMFCC